ncbi:NNMT/PNMT/TEMT family protein [Oesophagostomum dentatum]|uniref:NNMT/PNMT/TEMT family protein n=1 Tax=Oesophagostomum dentatum TaxID=61180 RepID=A0A0B1TU93_OESDE|nr:NNMT/PNMT/TEMT family protein [Oesophagostomum dentatum]
MLLFAISTINVPFILTTHYSLKFCCNPTQRKELFTSDVQFRESIEDGTRVSLFALPVFAHIIKQSMPSDRRKTLLDVGAGPTVYSALCFREVVERVYLSDYLSKNLDVLKAGEPYAKLFRTEGSIPLSDADMEAIEEKARGTVKCGGIMYANVHEDPVVPDLRMEQVSSKSH